MTSGALRTNLFSFSVCLSLLRQVFWRMDWHTPDAFLILTDCLLPLLLLLLLSISVCVLVARCFHHFMRSIGLENRYI